jgi:hypothetical protein
MSHLDISEQLHFEVMSKDATESYNTSEHRTNGRWLCSNTLKKTENKTTEWKYLKINWNKGMIYCTTLLNTKTENGRKNHEVWMLEFILIHKFILNLLAVNKHSYCDCTVSTIKEQTTLKQVRTYKRSKRVTSDQRLITVSTRLLAHSEHGSVPHIQPCMKGWPLSSRIKGPKSPATASVGSQNTTQG